MWRVLVIIFAVEKISITYFEYTSVALVIQHAKRMRRLPSVACPGLPYFSTIFYKWLIFGKEV
jgi:hypothetical protein